MTRLTRTGWLEIGLKQLSREGPAGLRVEKLCEAARRTRGSFYHHFVDQTAFNAALLEHWEGAHTEAIIEAVGEHSAEPRARRHELSRLTARLDPAVEHAIRRWAGMDDQAAGAIARVDARRLDFLAELNGEEFGLDDDRARDLAAVEYAVFVGFSQVEPEAHEDRLRAIGRMLDTMIAGYAASLDAR